MAIEPLQHLAEHLIDHAALKVATKADIDDIFDSGDADTSTDGQLNLDSEGQDTDFVAGVTVDVERFTTTSIMLSDEDYYVEVDDDAAGADVTVNLPVLASNLGRVFHIAKLGSTSDVILDPNGVELIEDELTATMSIMGTVLSVQATSSQWKVF